MAGRCGRFFATAGALSGAAGATSVLGPVLLIFGNGFCGEADILASPEIIETNYEWSGSAALKIGDGITWRRLETGAFVEVRNESRFNEKLLPNHHWRGFGILRYWVPEKRASQKSAGFFVGVSHQSAHATMGIAEETREALDMVYDKTYRAFEMNSLNAGAVINTHLAGCGVRFRAGYHFYFYSKNTPELPGKARTSGHGLNGGVNLARVIVQGMGLFLSFHHRTVFRGAGSRKGLLYVNRDGTVTQVHRDYPVIRSTHAFISKAGTQNTLGKSSRCIRLYLQHHYGLLPGYRDSRSRESRFSAGVSLGRL